jgi:hypothetical protein
MVAVAQLTSVDILFRTQTPDELLRDPREVLAETEGETSVELYNWWRSAVELDLSDEAMAFDAKRYGFGLELRFLNRLSEDDLKQKTVWTGFATGAPKVVSYGDILKELTLMAGVLDEVRLWLPTSSGIPIQYLMESSMNEGDKKIRDALNLFDDLRERKAGSAAVAKAYLEQAQPDGVLAPPMTSKVAHRLYKAAQEAGDNADKTSAVIALELIEKAAEAQGAMQRRPPRRRLKYASPRRSSSTSRDAAM